MSLPGDIDRKLRHIAKLRGQSRNAFIQHALREYIERLEILDIEKKLQAFARAKGIASDDDVVAMIHDYRRRSR